MQALHILDVINLGLARPWPVEEVDASFLQDLGDIPRPPGLNAVEPETSVRVGDLRRCRTVTVVSTAGSALVLTSLLYKSITGFAQSS
jgi:hypothetical protein